MNSGYSSDEGGVVALRRTSPPSLHSRATPGNFRILNFQLGKYDAKAPPDQASATSTSDSPSLIEAPELSDGPHNESFRQSRRQIRRESNCGRCRLRHLRCNGKAPCSSCEMAGMGEHDCVYQPSLAYSSDAHHLLDQRKLESPLQAPVNSEGQNRRPYRVNPLGQLQKMVRACGPCRKRKMKCSPPDIGVNNGSCSPCERNGFRCDRPTPSVDNPDAWAKRVSQAECTHRQENHTEVVKSHLLDESSSDDPAEVQAKQLGESKPLPKSPIETPIAMQPRPPSGHPNEWARLYETAKHGVLDRLPPPHPRGLFAARRIIDGGDSGVREDLESTLPEEALVIPGIRDQQKPATGMETSKLGLQERKGFQTLYGKGCRTCAQRRMVCDQRLPSCTQCVLSKRVCEGNPRPADSQAQEELQVEEDLEASPQAAALASPPPSDWPGPFSSDDQALLKARAEGCTWATIQQGHFPNMTLRACRDRHKWLVEHRLLLPRHDDSSDAHGETSSSEDPDNLGPPINVIVDNIMRFFVNWLDSRLGFVSCPDGRTGEQAQQETATRDMRSPWSSNGTGLHIVGTQFRNALRREMSDDDGDDEGTSRPPNKRQKTQGTETIEKVKLACPYFKHNPRKYKHQRPCCGPGWEFVHRVKEHLYRKHSLPKFNCHRCCQPFETEEELQAHARAVEPCKVRDPEPFDGFTQAQEKRLRSRKKTAGEGLSEPEKWRQMYRILFADVREDEMPSPYYEDSDMNTTNLNGYEDYLRRELPPMVRRQLEQEVERELNFVEESLKRRVVDMVRSLQLTLFRSYRKLEDAEARGDTAEGSSTNETAAEGVETPSDAVCRTEAAPMADPLNLLDDPLFSIFSESGSHGFEFLGSGGELGEPGDLGDASTMISDSGYMSGSPELEKRGEFSHNYSSLDGEGWIHPPRE